MTLKNSLGTGHCCQVGWDLQKSTRHLRLFSHLILLIAHSIRLPLHLGGGKGVGFYFKVSFSNIK